jgi:hypothetical protein
MKRFEIIEIANGWLICYHTEQGHVQRFFTDVDEIVEILKTIVPKQESMTSTGTTVKAER